MRPTLSRTKATILNSDLKGFTEVWKSLGIPGKGAAIGLALALPFVPGMLGSRKTGSELRDIYSGEEPVPVRQGRWWELGSTPYEGGRIKAWRPHWSVLHKSRAEDISLCGSEKEKWAHNPLLHPIKWLHDPYYLEKLHYEDRSPVWPAARRHHRPRRQASGAHARRTVGWNRIQPLFNTHRTRLKRPFCLLATFLIRRRNIVQSPSNVTGVPPALPGWQ
jgi:hypothetical protein